MDRKEFINTLGRYGIIAILAGIAGFSVFKYLSTDSECKEKYSCDSCSKSGNCSKYKKNE